MKGVLLVNMGGANSPMELKKFLSNMFKDPFILPYGRVIRNILSFIISNARYKKSWQKYKLIGGSPIIDNTKKAVVLLQEKLDEGYCVKMAFSYSFPQIKFSIKELINQGINDITVIPLYPQSSISTTSSVEKDVYDAVSKDKYLKINVIKEFYDKEGFVMFWSTLISNHIKKNNYSNPHIVFSAHSIPKFLVEKGDTYPIAIESSAKLIAGKLGYDYEFAYQSGMKKSKWIGPYTKDILKKMAENGKDEIVIIPISFVSENLETLYDIDYELIPFAKEKLLIKNISRVEIPIENNQFIELLKDLTKQII